MAMREALEAAFDQHTAEPEVQSTPEPAGETQSDTILPPVPNESVPVETPAPASTEPTRDALGRFTKTAQVDGKGQLPATEPVVAPVQTEPVERAPVNVPVGLRETWSTLPKEFRDYTTKRETEVREALQASSQARGFVENFFKTIQPYQQAIQIETGGNALQAVAGLMDTASRLRFGTPQEKASIITHLINVYGVDIQTLDASLAGQPQHQNGNGYDPSMIRREVQQALSPLMQQAEARRRQQEEQARSENERELRAFADDPKHEFYEDVKEVMADVLEIADRNRIPMTLEQAYNRACQMHPEVSGVLATRQKGETAQSLTKAAQRAKAAAVSVTGAAPVGSPDAVKPSSVREAIEAAIESHTRV